MIENQGLENRAVSLMCGEDAGAVFARAENAGVSRCYVSLGKRLLWNQYKENFLRFCEGRPKNV